MREELSSPLLIEAHDPAVKGLTVTAVEMSPDLQSARVYFSVLGGDPEREGAAEGLARASGYLRREVGRRCALRYAPELHFLADLARARRARRTARWCSRPSLDGIRDLRRGFLF